MATLNMLRLECVDIDLDELELDSGDREDLFGALLASSNETDCLDYIDAMLNEGSVDSSNLAVHVAEGVAGCLEPDDMDRVLEALGQPIGPNLKKAATRDLVEALICQHLHWGGLDQEEMDSLINLCLMSMSHASDHFKFMRDNLALMRQAQEVSDDRPGVH